MHIVKDLLSAVRTTVEAKVTQGKHELEGKLLFWALKGTLSVLIVVFLSISLFTWLTNALAMADLAALMTAVICVFAYALISFIQVQVQKHNARRNDELMLMIMPLVEAFIEGLNTEPKKEKEIKEKGE